MVYNGINFYPTDKSEADFIEHEKHHGLSDDQLKEVYALMNPKKKSSEPASRVRSKSPAPEVKEEESEYVEKEEV
jgi:hypothetical protein